MLTEKDKTVLRLLKEQPDRQMVVEGNAICHVGDEVIQNPIHRLLMVMALTELETQGQIARYEISRVGLDLLRNDEVQAQILGSI